MKRFKYFLFVYLRICVFVYLTFDTRECHIESHAFQKYIAHVGSFKQFVTVFVCCIFVYFDTWEFHI